MSAGVWTFTCEQGATWTREITWKADGIPVDLTGCLVRAMIRSSDDPAYTKSITCSVSDPSTGKILLSLTATETASIPALGYGWDQVAVYRYDVEVLFPDGFVSRLLHGAFCVSPEVTK